MAYHLLSFVLVYDKHFLLKGEVSVLPSPFSDQSPRGVGVSDYCATLRITKGK